ncbi:MAG: hypothetical protein R6W93_14245 [Candidatus Limnocylindrales bacterium]
MAAGPRGKAGPSLVTDDRPVAGSIDAAAYELGIEQISSTSAA